MNKVLFIIYYKKIIIIIIIIIIIKLQSWNRELVYKFCLTSAKNTLRAEVSLLHDS